MCLTLVGSLVLWEAFFTGFHDYPLTLAAILFFGAHLLFLGQNSGRYLSSIALPILLMIRFVHFNAGSLDSLLLHRALTAVITLLAFLTIRFLMKPDAREFFDKSDSPTR